MKKTAGNTTNVNRNFAKKVNADVSKLIKNIKSVIFTGIATEIGVDSSARDSSNRGFYTVVIRDCVSSWNKELHNSSLKALENICLVHSASDILAQWGKAT